MKAHTWNLLVLFLLVSLSACQLILPPTTDTAATQPAVETELVETEVPMADAPLTEVPPTDTLPPVDQPCGYQWASQDLPDVSALVQQTFFDAGLEDMTVRAQAFGENCVLPDGTVARFSTMYTDLFLQIPVASLTDDEDLGVRVEQALNLIRSLPEGMLPGGYSSGGYLGVEFRQGEQVRNLWFERTRGYQALDEGKRGSKLLQAVSNP